MCLSVVMFGYGVFLFVWFFGDLLYVYMLFVFECCFGEWLLVLWMVLVLYWWFSCGCCLDWGVLRRVCFVVRYCVYE